MSILPTVYLDVFHIYIDTDSLTNIIPLPEEPHYTLHPCSMALLIYCTKLTSVSEAKFRRELNIQLAKAIFVLLARQLVCCVTICSCELFRMLPSWSRSVREQEQETGANMRKFFGDKTSARNVDVYNALNWIWVGTSFWYQVILGYHSFVVFA